MSNNKMVLALISLPFIVAVITISFSESLYFQGAADYHKGIVVCVDLENTTHCVKKVEK